MVMVMAPIAGMVVLLHQHNLLATGEVALLLQHNHQTGAEAVVDHQHQHNPQTGVGVVEADQLPQPNRQTGPEAGLRHQHASHHQIILHRQGQVHQVEEEDVLWEVAAEVAVVAGEGGERLVNV
jgi:hypothetical protein